jgi:hypothetical protein
VILTFGANFEWALSGRDDGGNCRRKRNTAPEFPIHECPPRASCSKNREQSVEIGQYNIGHACLADVRAIASITYVLTYPVVYGCAEAGN